MAKDEPQTDIIDLGRRMQALFTPTGAAVPQVEQMMKLQQEMVAQTETFARHWFERRQEAAETGLEALREMSTASRTDPLAAMRAITDWQRGSFERLNADLQDWVALCTQLTQVAVTPESGTGASATNQNADKPKQTKAKDRAASGAQTEHATPV
ncbi:phasin family protein [Roseovarius tibetensis]|uniref:phasin family protein n=1 Tax=Roseovarius tibetensis TaxID=2685897 RepID=UPI003D7F9EB0